MTPPIVKRYFITLDRYKLLPLATLVLGVGVSGVVAVQPPPPTAYEATGVLTYNPPATSFTSTGPQIQEQGKQLTEAMLLDDKVVQEAAARVNVSPKEVRLKTKVKFPKPASKGGGAKDPKEAAPSRLEVIYVDGNPKKATAIVDTLMQGMVQQSRFINALRLEAIIKSINERLPKVKEELQTAEQNLEKYIRTEGPAILAAQDGTILGGITGSQQQQRQLVMTLGGIETQINSLQRRLGLNPDEAYTSSALSNDPIIANLRALIHQNETEKKILGGDYRSVHPKMIELEKKQRTYEELLQQRAAEVIGGKGKLTPLPAKIRSDSSLDPARQQLANTLVALQTQQETLQQQLIASRKSEQELRQEYAKVPNKQLEQARLQQQVQLHQVLYTKMVTALTDAKEAEAETVSSLSIAQPPQVFADVKPKQSIPLTVLVGGVVGLLVGGGLIFLLSSLDNTCYTPEEIREVLRPRDVGVLGEVPFITILKATAEEMPFLLNSDSPYLEFYERIRSSLPRASSKPLKVLLLTSTEAEEGKTISAYNLAIAAARAGKRTLVVEADLRSPTNAKSLRVAPDPHASIEPLRYYNQMSDCIRLVPEVENLYIVPSPGPLRNAALVLESSEFRRLLEDVRGRFDLVILDTPSLSSSNDAITLAAFTDGIVLVTRPGYTQESMLGKAVDELVEDEDELPLLGAIINGVDKVVPLPPDTSYLQEPIPQESSQHPEDLEETPVPRSRMKL